MAILEYQNGSKIVTALANYKFKLLKFALNQIIRNAGINSFEEARYFPGMQLTLRFVMADISLQQVSSVTACRCFAADRASICRFKARCFNSFLDPSWRQSR